MFVWLAFHTFKKKKKVWLLVWVQIDTYCSQLNWVVMNTFTYMCNFSVCFSKPLVFALHCLTADPGGVRDVETERHGATDLFSSWIKTQLEHKVHVHFVSHHALNFSRDLTLSFPVFRSSMHCDRYLKESEGSVRGRLGERACLSERDEREARYWTRKLYEFESNDPDRSAAMYALLLIIDFTLLGLY